MRERQCERAAPVSTKGSESVCLRSISRKSRDLDAWGSREVMVEVGIVVTVAMVVSE